MNIKRWIKIGLTLARFAIGTIFIYSGYSKLIAPSQFFELTISRFDIVPYSLIGITALMVPWIEYIVGAFLFTGFLTRKSAFVLLILTGSYYFILAQALIRRLPIYECGCFGGNIRLTLQQSFIIDSLILFLLFQIFTSAKLSYYSESTSPQAK